MARVPYLHPSDLAETDRSLLDRPAHLFRALAHSPQGLRNFMRLGGWIRTGSTLDPRLREMAILQVGYSTASVYEYTHHIALARTSFGVTDDDIDAIAAESAGESSGLPDLDRAVLRAAREMTAGLKASDATFAALASELSTEHVVDLIMTIAFYNLVVRVLATLEIDTEPEYLALLERFPLS